jgi:hypothetical protein
VYVLCVSSHEIDGGITWIYKTLEKLVVYVLCVSSHKIDGGISVCATVVLTWQIHYLNYATVVATHGRFIILRVLKVKCEVFYIKSIIANCVNEYKNKKCGSQHNILMDLALLTMLTYLIYIILMDLALLTVLAEQIRTIYY